MEIFQDKESGITLELKVDGETLWLDHYQLEILFDTDRISVGRNLKKFYAFNELDKDTTSAKIAQVQIEGGRNTPVVNTCKFLS